MAWADARVRVCSRVVATALTLTLAATSAVSASRSVASQAAAQAAHVTQHPDPRDHQWHDALHEAGPLPWTVVSGADDTEGAACAGSAGHRNPCVLRGTVGTVDACMSACADQPVFAWNQRSHHCYCNEAPVWKPEPNNHVTSGCRPGTVLGCPASPPPAPSPPPPPPPPEPDLPRLVPIPAGTFNMGEKKVPLPSAAALANFPNGDADEAPVHSVTLSAFHMGATEVTNRQYEQFDPSHRALRGKLGFSAGDDDAVLFVSHTNATAYCAWLSNRTGMPYALPTEAEWEYAARGNDTATMTVSPFWTGDAIPKDMLNNPVDTGIPTQGLPTRVGRFTPNGYGLYDTLGNVEEWVADWHGPYPSEAQHDPLGPPSGTFRATRGGSHSTNPYYLRTANRAGALPAERSWYIGFRVAAGGAAARHRHKPAPRMMTPDTQESGRPHEKSNVSPSPPSPPPSRVEAPPRSDRVRSKNASWPKWSSEPMVPVVRRYVNWPGNGSTLPFSDHNHEPTIAACPDGSVYTNWYSTNCGEPGRCVGLVDARLAPGAANWTIARVQLDAPDRCQCCTALYFDRDSGVLWHWSAMSAAGTYADIMGTLQQSTDCGHTWSDPKIIWPLHGITHQVVVTVIKSKTGEFLVPCDHWGVPPYQYEGDQSVIQHAPVEDAYNPAAWSLGGQYNATYNNTGSHHTSIVELRNGSFLAIGRAHDINGTMPLAWSHDGGHTWHPHASPFTGIHGGQREVMIRLGSEDQPLMLCTYANGPPAYRPTMVQDSAGGYFNVTGLYCAVSFDDGETWPNRRTITNDFTIAGHTHDGMDGSTFTMSYRTGEPHGYMAAAVADDGVIHLITSRNSYSFNLAWLAAKPDPPPKV